MDLNATLQELSAESHDFFEELKSSKSDVQLLSPMALDGLYVLAYQSLQAKKYREAFGLFSGLVVADITDARYMSGLAHSAQGSGQLQLAVQLHAMAVGLATQKDAFLLDLAQALFAVHQLSVAQMILQSIPTDSDLADAARALLERVQAMEALLSHAN